MKTIADIRSKVDKIEKAINSTKETEQEKLFKLYEGVKEIKEVTENLENFKKGSYSFDSDGSLIFGVDIPNAVADLPYINDFLTKEYYFIDGSMLAQCCGPCITVNWNHTNRSYFVYDHDTRKPIIEKAGEMEERHAYALIEQYQRKSGCFGDVVKTDTDGNYLSHVESEFSGLSEEELELLISKFNDSTKED